MEESSSTNLNSLALVQGNLEASGLRSLNKEEYTKLVLAAIDRVKRQFRDIDKFYRLPEPAASRRTGFRDLPWGDDYKAIVHYLLVEAAKTNEFGTHDRVHLLNRVLLHEDFEPVVLGFWLKQRGGLVVTIDLSWRYIARDVPSEKIFVVPVEAWGNLYRVLDEYAGHYFGYGRTNVELDYKFMCINLIKSIIDLVDYQEEKLRSRAAPFAQSSAELNAWIANAQKLEPVFRADFGL